MNHTAELKDRVLAKQKHLEARLATLRADSRDTANTEINKIEQQISEIKEQIGDGWDKLTERGAARLNEILKN